MANLDEFRSIKYGQGEQIRKAIGLTAKQRSDAGGGICFSLCCQWIALHRDHHKMGKGEQYRVSSMKTRIDNLLADTQYFYSALESQTVDYNTPGTKTQRKNHVGEKYRLMFDDLRKSGNAAQYKECVNRTHCYTQTSFQIPSVGRHAICAYKSSGKIFGIGSHLYVFDPNFGEFRVSTDKIEDFYRALRAEYYGTFKDITTYRVTTK